MDNQTGKTNKENLIQKLQSDPELLKRQPELFQKAVVDFFASMDQRLLEIENRWTTPLIK